MVTWTRLFVWQHGGQMATIDDAVKYLGKDKVYPAEQVMRVWGCTADITPLILYPTSLLKKCSSENKKKAADWRLVYIVGFSLRQLYDLRGVRSDIQPCFFTNSLWLRPEEDFWATVTAASGYYLINFNLQYRQLNWLTQEEKIGKLGDQFCRAHENIIAESVFSIFMQTQERLLEKDLHAGPSKDSLLCYVKIGYFDIHGLTISSVDFQRQDSGVLVYIKQHVIPGQNPHAKSTPLGT